MLQKAMKQIVEVVVVLNDLTFTEKKPFVFSEAKSKYRTSAIA